MKKLIALFALALPLVGQAEVTPLRCNVEKIVGARTSEDLKPTNFRPTGEYRILPADDVLAMFDGEDAEGLENMLNRHLLFKVDPKLEGAFIRFTSQNPKQWWSWTPCSVRHEDANDERKDWSKVGGSYLAKPAHSAYACADGSFEFNTLTNRFHRADMGDWNMRDDNSKSVMWEKGPAVDYVFEFGTCEPYYD